MTPEERETRERRLIDVNRRVGLLTSPKMSEEAPPELDSEELDELCQERDRLMRELDEDVD